MTDSRPLTENDVSVCGTCGGQIEYVAAIPEYGIEGDWLHRKGRWRVPSSHPDVPTLPPGSGAS